MNEAEKFLKCLIVICDKNNITLKGNQIMNGMNAWRDSKQREYNLKKTGNLTQKDHEKARYEAHRTSNSDREAGELVGLSRPAFRQWRAKKGLPPCGNTCIN